MFVLSTIFISNKKLFFFTFCFYHSIPISLAHPNPSSGYLFWSSSLPDLPPPPPLLLPLRLEITIQGVNPSSAMPACTPVFMEVQRWIRPDCRDNLWTNGKQTEATEQQLLHLTQFTSVIGTRLSCQVLTSDSVTASTVDHRLFGRSRCFEDTELDQKKQTKRVATQGIPPPWTH